MGRLWEGSFELESLAGGSFFGWFWRDGYGKNVETYSPRALLSFFS
jgi:hypothetical protein